MLSIYNYWFLYSRSFLKKFQAPYRIKISEYFSVYYQWHTIIKADLITSTVLDISSPLELLRKESLAIEEGSLFKVPK